MMAKRELSQSQFEEQLKKRGFRQTVGFPFCMFKCDELPNISIGGIHDSELGLLRRRTISHLERTRTRLLKEQA